MALQGPAGVLGLVAACGQPAQVPGGGRPGRMGLEVVAVGAGAAAARSAAASVADVDEPGQPGGGVVLQQINRDNLHQRCQVVYLHSAPEEIFRRLQHDRHRPLLQVPDPLAKLKELYELRDPLYRETAHFVIETGRPSVSTMVNMIVMQLEVAGVIGQ